MFSETSLSEKKEIYGNLKMEDITDADYKHTKRILEDFGTKHLGQYDDLYITEEYIITGRCIWKLPNQCIEIHKPDPACFLSAPRLSW